MVFIKGWKKNVLEIEMAGGEFCGNAIRSVMYYLNVTQGKTNAKIKYTNYCFVVDCECVNSDCSFKVKQRDLIKNIIEIGNGFDKVEMAGITHYVIQSNSKYFTNRNSATKTKELINMLIKDELSVGVMYLENFKLTAYVYVKNVNTLYMETACGSGTIASAVLFQGLKNVKILQPSGEILMVNFNKGKLTLSGKCKTLMKDYIII